MKEIKNVPQLRFSGFNDEWEENKLGDSICEINERTSDFNLNPLFSLTIENGITEKTERYERSQLVTKEDDLFKIMHPQNFATNPMNLRFGAVGYSKEKNDISVSGYYDVFSIDNNKCSDFWYSYFKTDKTLKKFDDAATGSLIEKRRVHFSVLKQLSFLQPNFNEKQKIGSFLSHVDSLIKTKTKKLESLKAVKKSLLQKCFPKAGEKVPEMRFAGFSSDWEEKKLGEVAVFSKGHGYSKNDLIPDGDPIILYGRMYTNYETVISNIETFVHKQENSVLSKGGEIIIPASGETAEDIARASVVEKEGIILGGDINIISLPKSVYDSSFVALSVSHGESQKELCQNAQGKTIVHLHNDDIRKISIMFPSLDEQQKIGQFFSKYDSLITAQQKEIDKLRYIKKSLLQKMFV